MDFIEILFVLLFIVVPLLEGLFRKNRSKGPALPRERPGGSRPGTGSSDRGRTGAPQRPADLGGRMAEAEGRQREGYAEANLEVEAQAEASADRSAGPATDMVPEDLWSILTGEQRPRARVEREPAPVLVEEEIAAGWSDAGQDDWAAAEEADHVEAQSLETLPPASWETSIEDTEIGEAESLEYVGPEAVSLEQPLPSPEVRHRAFHRRIDPPPKPVLREVSWVTRGLLRPGGLQRAVVLSEVLGAPRGLED